MMDEGYYKAVAQAAELGESKTGTPQVAVVFKVTEPGEHDGKEMWWYGYFKSDASKRIAINGLRAAGWTGDNLEDVEEQLNNSDHECVLKVVHEEYEGEIRARVAFVNEAGRRGGSATPLDDQGKKRLAAEMSSFIKSMDTNGGKVDPKDDVPF